MPGCDNPEGEHSHECPHCKLYFTARGLSSHTVSCAAQPPPLDVVSLRMMMREQEALRVENALSDLKTTAVLRPKEVEVNLASLKSHLKVTQLQKGCAHPKWTMKVPGFSFCKGCGIVSSRALYNNEEDLVTTAPQNLYRHLNEAEAQALDEDPLLAGDDSEDGDASVRTGDKSDSSASRSTTATPPRKVRKTKGNN